MAAQHHEAERGVLSALLQRTDDSLVAFRELTAKDFSDPLHRRFFGRFKWMIEEGEPLILAAIIDGMKPALDGVETARLSDLLDRLLLTRQPGELASYVRLVKRASRERDLKKICDDVVNANGDATGLILDLQGKIEKYFESLRETIEAPGVIASTVKPEMVKWFWPGRIPLGKITIIDGDPDRGKSLLSIDLAARCTSGREMPDGAPGAVGGAVLLNAEDDTADTIIPRLIAGGADLNRVLILKTLARDGGRQIEIPLDIPAIREAAISIGAVLIVIDPLMAFLAGKTNSWHDQDIRRALAPLAELAAELRAAIVVIRHLNKGASEGNPLYRGGGSIGIIGAARAGLIVGDDPDDGTGKTKILAVSKSNLSRKAPSLRYRIIPHNNSVVVEWCGESEHHAATLLAAPEGEQRWAVEECKRFIVGFLEDGAQPASDVIAAARKAGFSDRTVDRAKVRARVEPYRAGFGKDGKWMWNITQGANP
jgi:AAA domain/DnaB-like helicase N terminal domain